ncbi:hypothetical protein LUZ63_020209 [Rhynchospora breviuscula]|uniref:Methyltransferase domain-containing protein n=1 Tax=Rhynchospora breviuscula TaxID=2022672 RepID=A0A9Q0C0L0_9POAL|nr:hypothetical protein LUZ63_020209 [Rhynchospora breviuscula]
MVRSSSPTSIESGSGAVDCATATTAEWTIAGAPRLENESRPESPMTLNRRAQSRAAGTRSRASATSGSTRSRGAPSRRFSVCWARIRPTAATRWRLAAATGSASRAASRAISASRRSSVGRRPITSGMSGTMRARASSLTWSLTERAVVASSAWVQAGWSDQRSPASHDAISMKQAPLRGVRCRPRESTGTVSGTGPRVGALRESSDQGERDDVVMRPPPRRRTWVPVVEVCARRRRACGEPAVPPARHPRGADRPHRDRRRRRAAAVSEPLLRALTRLRGLILDEERLVRAVASGRRKGQGEAPRWRRAELRYVDLKAGRRLQSVTFDATQSFTANHAPGPEARDAVDDLLDVGFGQWEVETLEEVHRLRVTKAGEAVVTTAPRADDEAPPDRSHDRTKDRLLAEDHPVLRALGISGGDGRVLPTRQAKYRQVEEFLRLLDTTLTAALDGGRLRRPTAEDPLRVVDLGCGNAYLSFAAHAHLAARGLPVRMTGVDTKAQSLRHGREVADALGLSSSDVDFVQGGIGDAEVEPAPEVVLALHACDTASDDALARAVGWQAPVVLAAPCCHHDVAAQLRRAPTPPPYDALTRDGILRERLADTLTDALRASVLRLEGYRVDVVEFVGSQHTPRNTLLRAVRTGRPGREKDRQELEDLTATWRVVPRLTELLAHG